MVQDSPVVGAHTYVPPVPAPLPVRLYRPPQLPVEVAVIVGKPFTVIVTPLLLTESVELLHVAVPMTLHVTTSPVAGM